jgi:inner membrane transporter RhtA
MNLTFYLALRRIPLGLAVTLEFLGPLGVALLGSRRALDFLWVGLAGLGIALIAPWASDVRSLDRVGVALALVAGTLWAAYILLGARTSMRVRGGAGVAAGMLFASLLVIPFALNDGLATRLTPSVFAAGLAVALLSSAVPYTLEANALRVISSRTFGILMSLEPAVAALAGLLFLGEMLAPSQWLAVVCISAASAGAALGGRKGETSAEA